VTPKEIQDLVASRSWFHTIEVAPGVFTPGHEDTPRKAELIGLPKDLSGKSVLDIGAYDGYFSFEAERRHASRVLAFDHLDPDLSGFSTAKRILGSNVEHMLGSVYNLTPELVGHFDIVLFLGVIYHLRSPLLALQRVHSVCNEMMFLESQVTADGFLLDGKLVTSPEIKKLLKSVPIAQYFPGSELNNDPTNWWAPSALCLEQLIQAHGFKPRLVAEWNSRAAFQCLKGNDPAPYWLTKY
jgi:tRNA (mo5U34)-methyltransferase